MSNLVETEFMREIGHEVRRQVISYFTRESFLQRLQVVLSADALPDSAALPSGIRMDAVLADMVGDDGWAEECWTVDDSGVVRLVSERQFAVSDPACRFSKSDTLRRPRRDAYALRGLLSGLHSDEVAEAFSAASGCEAVGYKSADIARYRPGHYLRRHDDVYDGRIFGLVFFAHEKWEPASGTCLVAEKPDGRCQVIAPAPSTVAVMRLAGGHFHQVQPNLSRSWHRYSIAVHFGAADA